MLKIASEPAMYPRGTVMTITRALRADEGHPTPVMSHEERIALIYAPFPVVKVPTLHSDHALGARRWNLSQVEQEREAW